MRYQIWYDPDDASLVMGEPSRLEWDRQRGSLGPRAQLRQEFADDSWEAVLRAFVRYAALDRVLLR